MKPLLKKIGIPEEGFSLYSLRHTHCALRIMNGDNVFVIATDMGTSVAMISATYGHVPKPVTEASSDKLARLIHGT